VAVRLFVGNMPYGATDADLRSHFAQVGEPSQIVIPVDRETGRPRGFAFVEMGDQESAQRAISELDKHQYGGRSLTVNEAKPMEPRNGGGRNGSFGGGRQRRESRW